MRKAQSKLQETTQNRIRIKEKEDGRKVPGKQKDKLPEPIRCRVRRRERTDSRRRPRRQKQTKSGHRQQV